ncbi:DUF3349 domain-containing protein [Mycobacterium sp. ENV421]|nr:DUF3349 domain-containing protein [Mycobacterium sp. ENV421]
MIRRFVAWVRQDYPKAAPTQGHSALVALYARRGAVR